MVFFTFANLYEDSLGHSAYVDLGKNKWYLTATDAWVAGELSIINQTFKPSSNAFLKSLNNKLCIY